MNVSPSPTSTLLKAFAGITKWALWLALSAWLLFGAVWGTLHWLIVPRIGDFRPQLEARASKALGVPVRIGAISARSLGSIPSFELQDVKLLDAKGDAALWLPRVMVALSPQSLLGFGFDQLHIDQPEVNVHRSADGKLTVAGFDFSKNEQGDGSGADWFFSQTEFVIRNGTLHWTDDMRSVPPLDLTKVDLVVRNSLRKHALRIDAVLPSAMGGKVSTMAVFKQPLLKLRNGQWREWDGQLYGAFDRVDVATLAKYVDLGLDIADGEGSLHTWIDMSKGLVTGATADVQLANVNTTLSQKLEPLTLKTMAGRLGGRFLPDGFEFSTQGLQFQTQDGLTWPGGNFLINYKGAALDASVTGPGRGELTADKLDLAALSEIANRLPLGEATLAALAAWTPKGLVENFSASWQSGQGPLKYQAKGRVSGLELSPSSSSKTIGPSVRGATVEFDLNQTSGRAKVALKNGSIVLPGVFDDPEILLAQMSTDATWQVEAERISVQMPNLTFNNADAQGQAQVKWQTNAPNAAKGVTRFPGAIDLQGTMSRLQGTQIHRYLPSIMLPKVRGYVRDSLKRGSATDVKFKVKGNIFEIPFVNPKAGEFSISAKFADVNFDFAPRRLLAANTRPWPELVDMSGDFLIDRVLLQIKGVTGKVVGTSGPGEPPSLQVTKAEGQIADLLHQATVAVSVEGKGPLSNALGLVNTSPLGFMISDALAQATATGAADLKMKLNLPIGALEKTTVQGSVNLSGNDIQISPATPLVSAARGMLNFSERGFTLANTQGRMFGGEMLLEGGTSLPALPVAATKPASPLNASRDAPGIVLRARGTVSAEAIRQAKNLGYVSRIAAQATGSAAYSATLGFRGGYSEIQIATDLVGVALNLPAPLGKTAEAALPLRFENSLLREPGSSVADTNAPVLDQLKLDIGKLASLTYVRDVSGAEPKVLRGSIAVGLAPDESAPMPAQGVVANVNMTQVDLDAWSVALTQATGVKLTAAEATATAAAAGAVVASQVATVSNAATASTSPISAPAPVAGPVALRGSANPALGYLPNTMAIRAGELVAGGRKLSNVVVGGSREGLTWRANLDATELNGYAEYRQPAGGGPGRIFARLARLTLAQASAKDVESLLDDQPASIPALDIVVDDLELRGKKLGRIEIEAINRGASLAAREGGVREWRLAKFNVVMPEAVFTATGNWAAVNAQSLSGGGEGARLATERRRTVMNFKLDVQNAGELLTRFGMKGVFRQGKGKLEGQVSWAGSPITPDYPSMSGAFAVNVEAGQFMKADPGLAKLLGVLSLQSLPRRLALDFRDVFSDGFSFDFVRGNVTIEQGIASTNNLQMKGVNAAVLMDGRADIAKETQDIRVIVVPEINAGTASLIATVINPAIGLGTFLAQVLLRGPLIEASTQEFHIDGSWLDPQVTPVKRKSDAGKTSQSEASR